MIAPEFIAAQCPKCGGKIDVDPGKDTLICQFCNTEFVIRRNVNGTVNLDTYARCPLCQRNDQAQKVSAILNKQTSQSNGYVPQQKVYTDSDGRIRSETVNVHVQTAHQTTLAQKLAAPAAPKAPTKGCFWWLFLGLPPAALFLIRGVNNSLWYYKYDIARNAQPYVTQAIISFLVFIGLIALYVIFKKGDNSDFQQKTKQYISNFAAWKRAMAQWEVLYYCGRDDVVFLPGEKTCAKVDEMVQYLYTSSEKR